MAKEYPQETLDKARPLKGKLSPDKKFESMTPLEQAVLRNQGLVDDNDNIKPEAFVSEVVGSNLPAHIAAPVPLEQLEPDAAEKIASAVSDARGTSADAAEIDETMQVDEPLPPPEISDDEVAVPTEDDGFGSSTTMNVEVLLRGAKEPIPCPRCAYDVRKRFDDPEFEPADKAAFVRHIVSKDGRFEKRFPLLDGKMAVTLRSRSQKEMEMIFNCVRERLQKDDLLPGGDYVAQMQHYHVVASVASIESGDVDSSEKFPTLSSLQDKDNPVQHLESLVFGEGRSSGLYNVITAIWLEFDRLYGWFSSKAHEPDFWKAAAGPHS